MQCSCARARVCTAVMMCSMGWSVVRRRSLMKSTLPRHKRLLASNSRNCRKGPAWPLCAAGSGASEMGRGASKSGWTPGACVKSLVGFSGIAAGGCQVPACKARICVRTASGQGNGMLLCLFVHRGQILRIKRPMPCQLNTPLCGLACNQQSISLVAFSDKSQSPHGGMCDPRPLPFFLMSKTCGQSV